MPDRPEVPSDSDSVVGVSEIRQASLMVFAEGVRLPRNASAAEWIAPLLGEFGTVGGLVPDGFEQYIAMPHQPPGTIGEWTAPTALVEGTATALADHTSTPDTVCFATWEGYGFLEPIELERLPTFDLPHRRYYLAVASASAAPRLHRREPSWPPDLWWPDDRSWFVATDTDLSWSYLGATRSACDAVIARLPWQSTPVQWTASNAEAGRLARAARP